MKHPRWMWPLLAEERLALPLPSQRENTAKTQGFTCLDGAKSLGAKILVSGGGRCNVTHDRVTPKDFFGNRHIIRNVLAACSLRTDDRVVYLIKC